MSQVPEIKAEVNKESEKDKKKAGLLARLFGGGSSGGGLGGGALGGFGNAAAGGGLLATKAGLMALILAGTTVAGGIGLVGYRLFGPGQDSGSGDNLSVFAPKPQNTQSADASAPQDGSSQSLNMFAQGNPAPKAPDAASAEAPKDATAAGAAASGSDASAYHGPINAAGNAGNGNHKGLAKEGRFGKLTSSFGGAGALGGGGGSSAVANGAGKSPAELAAAAARTASLSGMSHGRAASGGGRSIAGRRSGKALGQAFSSLKDGRGATTSYGAGHTFDGSATDSGGTTGPAAGAITAGPTGTADGGQPKALPANQNTDSKEFKAPPTPDATMAAPWQGAINTAQMLLAAGGLLLFLIGKIKVPWLRYAIGAIVIAMGLAIVALGAKVSGGQWGQKLQGGVLAAAGVGLSAAAVLSMMMTHDDAKGTADKGFSTDGGKTIDVDKAATAHDMMMGINPYVLLGGGAALIGIATCQLKPPVKHPVSDFENGKVPDAGFFGYQQFPSEKALKDMVV